MTDAELQAIRERCEKATAGPWEVFVVGDDGSALDYTIVCAPESEGGWDILKGTFVNECEDRESWSETCRNNDFIAHARTDIPALLCEVDRLRRYEHALRQMALPVSIEEMLLSKEIPYS